MKLTILLVAARRLGRASWARSSICITRRRPLTLLALLVLLLPLFLYLLLQLRLKVSAHGRVSK